MTDKDNFQAEIFKNRITKKYRTLKKWARTNGITCFRIYDKDIPEVPLCLDIYEFLPPNIKTRSECECFISAQNERQSANDSNVDLEIAKRRYVILYLYKRPYEKDPAEENEWLSLMSKVVQDKFMLGENQVIIKQRQQQKGSAQYEKAKNEKSVIGVVQECGVLFKVDLKTYIDTGLFLDTRILRSKIRDQANGKSVLNLFCYTASFSVFAAIGGASKIQSVDLSNTYLSWAKENFLLNGFDVSEKIGDENKFMFTKRDVIEFLNEAERKQKMRYDMIILDPPTFSNSKMTNSELDINRDWSMLVQKCLNILNPGGTLYFCTNSKRIKFDETLVPKINSSGIRIFVNDITAQTIPNDFADKKPHKIFEFTLGENQ